MIKKRKKQVVSLTLFFLVGIPSAFMALVLAFFLIGPFANATYSPAKSVITLSGVGSAPSCPSGWTEIVGQTAAGTFSPITSISTFNARRADGNANLLCTYRYVDTGGGDSGGGGGETCDGNTTQPLASGGSATTYTHYYRVCER